MWDKNRSKKPNKSDGPTTGKDARGVIDETSRPIANLDYWKKRVEKVYGSRNPFV